LTPSWSEPLNYSVLKLANPTPGIITSDKEEWERIVSQGSDGRWLVNNKDRSGTVMCEDFLQHEMTIKAGLGPEEVIALRLYTGPAFHKYNTHLRFGLSEATKGDGAPTLRAKKERPYTTTIHAIASALKKVARVTKLPEVSRLSLSLSLFLSVPLSLTLCHPHCSSLFD